MSAKILKDYKNGYTIEGAAKKHRIPFMEAYFIVLNSDLELRIDKHQRVLRDAGVVSLYKKNKNVALTAATMKMSRELVRLILIKGGLDAKSLKG